MPTPRRRPPARSTAPRRRRTRRRNNRSAFRTFFLVLLFLAAFALLYTFAGDLFGGDEAVQPVSGEVLVHFIDVGQGHATLVQSPNHAVLIDGGEPRYGTQVVNYLRNAGVTRLDYVVATHPHADHIGGLIHVLNQMEVGTVIMPDATNDTLTFERFMEAIINHDHNVRFVTAGDALNAGDIRMTVLGPVQRDTPWPRNQLNNASVVLRMQHGEMAFMFTGDVERAGEESMLASGRNLRADVLHVSHHGSNTSTIQAFLDAVSPSIAVISSGEGNTHGHPHPAVLTRLEAANVRILRNDERGDIILKSTGSEIILLP
ncbi:MAG: MBL fold metallo-hydrolase [Defluviitaleaceae bacterium]|nr:MBL fold metallo-hydrolase [Defluviitaleaceae bacterium]